MEKAYQQAASDNQRISDETARRRNILFEQYVQPYLRMIYKLCINYTNNPEDIQDNYTDVLTNIYKYIETYDSGRSIHTWLHIVTKRFVFAQNEKRQNQKDMRNRDNEVDTFSLECDSDETEHISYRAMNLDNYTEFYNDDILDALEQLKPSYKRALLLQQAGYKLREIAEIEYKNGALESRNIETVKSRLFLARQQLQQLLTRDGNKRTTEETD